MISIKVETPGAEKEIKRLGAFSDAIEEALDKVANEIRERVIDRTPVDQINQPGGTLKAGWGEIEKVGGWGQVENNESGRAFSNPVSYGHVLEEGLYPGVGPRTVRTSEGIFSSQAVGGIMGPLVNDPSYRDFLLDLFIKALEEVLNKKK